MKHPRYDTAQIINRKKIAGHKAVTESLINGLIELHKDFNYDPILSKNIKNIVVVLSGVDTLKYAIELKKNRKIDILYAGPNLVVHADEYNCLVGSKEIDKLLIPSKWVKKAYEKECSRTKGKILIWPSGTDPKFWKPVSLRRQSNKILLYKKVSSHELPKGFYKGIVNDIRSLGYEVEVLEYGKYSKSEFKEGLLTSIAMVYISKTESQGIALLESWAMNVPTLVWKSNEKYINGRKYDLTSSAPFLTKDTGFFWVDEKQLIDLIKKDKIKLCNPRKWVINNMSDVKSAKTLIDNIGNNFKFLKK